MRSQQILWNQETLVLRTTLALMILNRNLTILIQEIRRRLTTLTILIQDRRRLTTLSQMIQLQHCHLTTQVQMMKHLPLQVTHLIPMAQAEICKVQIQCKLQSLNRLYIESNKNQAMMNTSRWGSRKKGFFVVGPLKG